MKRFAALAFGASLFGSTGFAGTIAETFDTRANFAGGTAVWNQELGKVHPSLQVDDYLLTPSPPSIGFDVGDGSDGRFDHDTYANFSTGGNVSGQTIRIDTDLHPILQVTSFTLDAGWFIVPSGSKPLTIKSLSGVKILGEIHCEGDAGEDASGSVAGGGGHGRCGGMNGGSGGAPNTPGDDGTPTDVLVSGTPPVTGGGAGTLSNVHGGGGGSWSSAGPATAGFGGGGSGGTSDSDYTFQHPVGSAGGGGGAGDASTAGGGGGAGGGAVLIFAVGDVEIGASGYIFANGGQGGNASGSGGAGGGGGGGSVQIFSGGDINLFNTDASGATQAASGVGGTNVASETGGNGALGRSWLGWGGSRGGTGGYNPPEESPGTSGLINFSTQEEYVESRVFDLGGQFATIDALTLTPASNEFVFEVAASSDGFSGDDTGWTTDLARVSHKRYLKMRLKITSASPWPPSMIDSAEIDYTLGRQDNFKFQNAGCGRVDGGGSPWNSLWLLAAPLLLLLLKFKAQRQLACK